MWRSTSERGRAGPCLQGRRGRCPVFSAASSLERGETWKLKARQGLTHTHKRIYRMEFSRISATRGVVESVVEFIQISPILGLSLAGNFGGLFDWTLRAVPLPTKVPKAQVADRAAAWCLGRVPHPWQTHSGSHWLGWHQVKPSSSVVFSFFTCKRRAGQCIQLSSDAFYDAVT